MNKPNELHTTPLGNKAEHARQSDMPPPTDPLVSEGKDSASLSYTASKHGVEAKAQLGKGGHSVVLNNPFAFGIVFSTALQEYQEAMERNTVRYFMAVEAFIAELHAPAQEQLEQRLEEWQAGTGGYRYALAKKSRE